MSSTVARSFSINDPCALKNVIPPNPVLALLDGAALHKINWPPHDLRQLLLSANHIPQAPPGIVFKTRQEIDIAVGAEIIAQSRPKHCQLANLPFFAERLQRILRQFNSQRFHSNVLDSIDGLSNYSP